MQAIYSTDKSTVKYNTFKMNGHINVGVVVIVFFC